jgi:uncharacterized protein YndB with AHSA1/START domain
MEITVSATINAPIEKVWKCWITPEDICNWNAASDDWHTPRAENDLRVGGRFVSRMESKDGTMGFDFNGVYTEVETHEKIAYTIEGGREVKIFFSSNGGATEVIETFDAEDVNAAELQRAGWQAILDNFKFYVEKSI